MCAQTDVAGDVYFVDSTLTIDDQISGKCESLDFQVFLQIFRKSHKAAGAEIDCQCVGGLGEGNGLEGWKSARRESESAVAIIGENRVVEKIAGADDEIRQAGVVEDRLEPVIANHGAVAFDRARLRAGRRK